MPPKGTLEVEATVVLERVRSTFGEVIASIPGGVRRAADVHRALHIDQPVGWSVFRTATARDPLAAGVYVPRPKAGAKFLKAARKAGLPSALVDAADAAYAEFEHLVAQHAGADHEVFETLMGNLTGERSETAELKHRRAAYRANVHLKGVFADSYLVWSIYAPGSAPNTIQAGNVRGYTNMRTLDRQKGFIVDQGYAVYTHGRTGVTTNKARVIGESASPSATIGFLRPFCSEPLPTVTTKKGEDGRSSLSLEFAEVGQPGACTWFTGLVFEDVPVSMPALLATFTVPAEQAYCYSFVHRDLWPGEQPDAAVYLSNIVAGGQPVFRESEKLGPPSEVVVLPARLSSLSLTRIPYHADMVSYVFDGLGFDLSEFVVVHCRIDYPVLFSALRLRFAADRDPD